MSDSPPPEPSPDASREPTAPRRRRARYAGTHPRRFEQRYKEQQPDKYPDIVDHVRAQGRTPAGSHVPIMVAEVLNALRPAPGDIAADLTLGYGGHAAAILERTAEPVSEPGCPQPGPDADSGAGTQPGWGQPGSESDSARDGVLIGLDLDGPQLEATRARLAARFGDNRLVLRNSHFAGLPKVLAEPAVAQVLAACGRSGVDVMLADLGLSSMQIDDPSRGFSYKHAGPLDMRMDRRKPRTAAELVATLTEDELATALVDLADEPDARGVARAIAHWRTHRPIATTRDLADAVLSAKGLTRKTWREMTDAEDDAAALHPAARTFQALRILVNDEMHGLEQLLRIAPWCLNAGGRFAILTFHRGEDRRVAEALAAGIDSGVYSAISPEPQRPSPEERRSNPRSKAARLRWAVRAGG